MPGTGLKSDCATPVTTNAATSAYVPLLDDNTQTCSGNNCVYRNTWAAALASAFGSGTCAIPYSSITSCHFYDMDNEIDIWGGTHRDIHPNPSGYDELATTFLTEAAKLKGWDPQAVRFGPVSCCWWYYWNGANGNDKNAHGGVDFLPWWLNQLYWQDQISGTRTLDMFDLHALSRCQHQWPHHIAAPGFGREHLSRLLGSNVCEPIELDQPAVGDHHPAE